MQRKLETRDNSMCWCCGSMVLCGLIIIRNVVWCRDCLKGHHAAWELNESYFLVDRKCIACKMEVSYEVLKRSEVEKLLLMKEIEACERCKGVAFDFEVDREGLGTQREEKAEAEERGLADLMEKKGDEGGKGSEALVPKELRGKEEPVAASAAVWWRENGEEDSSVQGEASEGGGDSGVSV